LNAYLQAKYRVLVVQSAVPDAGLHCNDILNREQLFLMDLAFSRSLSGGAAALATRTIPLGEYWMTAGAALPIHSANAIQDALSRIESGNPKSLESSGSLALYMVRACLAAGAADYVTYQGTEGKARAPRRQPRWPRFKWRR
jgi:hypothetical protein